ATVVQIAYVVTTVFAFNLVAIAVFPPIGQLLGLIQSAFGLWTGTAINDTSSVVAAAYSFGSNAGAQAVVVKLTRTLAILPIAAALTLVALRRSGRATTVAWSRIV